MTPSAEAVSKAAADMNKESTYGTMLDALRQAESLLLTPQHQAPDTAAAAAAAGAAHKRCVAAIAGASADLRHALESARKSLGEFDKACAAGVAVSDIVAYAQRISGTTSAPAYWKPGMPMVGFLPPAPLPEMMRMGALTRLNAGTAATSAVKHEGPITISHYFTPGAAAEVAAPESPKARGTAAVKEEAKEVKVEVGRPAPLHRAPSMVDKGDVKKPKIVVDLDDLESSSEESSSEGSEGEGGDSDET
ncbi:hypothetical protein JKP88DRAFT_263586 [Tribonema minus]|uniref:Mediator of RNA polymerase II transcription subunit 4 n=1 Tax=Tribonema minus TaxID=303371 RepID=A0A835YUZ4_9STRA|nr:hypothetical protein JKP88DRAFT_263586 [Tribonema minus]